MGAMTRLFGGGSSDAISHNSEALGNPTDASVITPLNPGKFSSIRSMPVCDTPRYFTALEAIYTNDFQSETSATASESDASNLALWWKVEAAQVEGKTATWIIENLLGKKGRKFAEGRAQLTELIRKFGGTEAE